MLSCSVVSTTLCHPMDCSLPDPLSMGILQARIQEWVACPSPGDLPNPEIKLTVQVDSLPSEPPGKPKSAIINKKRKR